MDILTYFSENHYQIIAMIASSILIIELAVFGACTPMLFVGLSCIIVSFLSYIGFISGWAHEIFYIGVISIVLTLLLWKRIRNLMDIPANSDDSSDMIGKILIAKTEITKRSGKVSYTGVDWTARIDPASELESLEKDRNVCISKIEGTVIFVLPA